MNKPLFQMLAIILIIANLFSSASCKKGDGPEPGQQPQTEAEWLQEMNNRFPFSANQPFEAIYQCGRSGSQLLWFFLFREDGTMQALFTTDTHDDFAFDGTYTYTNDQIRLMMPGGPTMPFPQGLDETTTSIMPQMGLVAAFATPQMICICDGHTLNTQAPPQVQANYDCPIINIQAASDEDNAVEFVHREVPFAFPVTGSIFRQQDIYINGAQNPIIRRGFGIYRQQGDRFYANFRVAADFAQYAAGNLPFAFNPGLPFEDYNLLTGEFRNNGQEIIVDQLMPEEGPCSLR